MNYKQTRAAIVNAAAILRKNHPKGGSPTHAAMEAALKLDECLDATEWTEKGLAAVNRQRTNLKIFPNAVASATI